MQQRPGKIDLLRAIAEFLVQEAYPAIADKRLNFRVLIAANLASMVASELENEKSADEGQVARLRALIPELPRGDRPFASAADELSHLNQYLAVGLRTKRFSEEEKRKIWEHTRKSLVETLAVTNPRFDTSAEVG